MKRLALQWMAALPWFRPQAEAARQSPARPPAAPRKRWFKNTGMFYAVSATCHVLCVGLLIALPLKELRAIKKIVEPTIDAEVKEEPRSTHFELGGGHESGRGSSTTNVVPQTGIGDGPRTSDDELHARLSDQAHAGEVIAVPAGMLADSEAAERAIAAALGWFDRHQSPDGRWSLGGFHLQCAAEQACDQSGGQEADSAATGLVLISYFREAQTQQAAGPHAAAVKKGLDWLLAQQAEDGDLSAGATGRMYPHAIATLALCENYALTRDSHVGVAAQKAIEFIVRAQNAQTGGWHYEPGGTGNTSVFAWQMLALRTAQRCGLKVDAQCFTRSEKWLTSVASGNQAGLFCYEPGRPPTPTMTAVGTWCRQIAGGPADSPALLEGSQYLIAHPAATPFSHDVFYWYFGAPVVRRLGGREWDNWFQQLRRTLIDTQQTEGCAAGSWQLELPAPEAWSARGGRLMLTSFAVQLLELEYGYSPLTAPAAEPPVRAAGRQPSRKRE